MSGETVFYSITKYTKRFPELKEDVAHRLFSSITNDPQGDICALMSSFGFAIRCAEKLRFWILD